MADHIYKELGLESPMINFNGALTHIPNKKWSRELSMTLDKKYLLDMVERENDIQADFIAGEYRNKFYVTHTYHHTIDPALFGVSKISSKTKFEARKVTENPNAILFQTRAEDKYALAEEMRAYYHHELEINSWGVVDYVESVCEEFRELYENIKGTTPYCVKRVAVLNCWGKMRAWGCHMVHHALYYKQNYSYSGVIEMLSGAPFDVKFISFEDIKNDPKLLETVDVIINVGDADTAHTGGIWWEDPEISSAIRRFVWNGGGFIGVGEPSGHPYQGHILQMASVLGVEEENGFTLNYDKYNWEEHPNHFILQDADQPIDFGEGKKNIYALEGTEVLVQRNKEVQMAAHDFGKGRAVYISGVPYSFANSRTLYRAILWSAHSEEELHTWFSSNYNVEVHAYVKNGKYCVVNNTYEPQDTTVYTTDGNSFDLHLDANEIRWYEI